MPESKLTPVRPVFYFPATAAMLLRADSWMGDVAIGCWLRAYGEGGHSAGQPVVVKSRRPDSHHYRLQAGDGGFYVTSGPLSSLVTHTPMTGPR